MARGGANKELAATVLVEAVYFGDQKACERNGLSLRTLQNYRRRLAEGDAELAELFAKKSAEMQRAWVDTLPDALRESVEFIAAAARAARQNSLVLQNPMMITAVAGAMKLLADVYYTGKVIDARLAQTNKPPAGLLGEVPADSEPASPFVQ